MRQVLIALTLLLIYNNALFARSMETEAEYILAFQ